MAKLQHRRPTREASPAPQRAKLAEAAPTGPVSLRHPAPGAIVQRAMAAPHSLRPAELIAMQRTLGNRAVGAMLAPIQAKLIVNAPGDEYEREADRVADAVMGAPAASTRMIAAAIVLAFLTLEFRRRRRRADAE